MTAEAARRSEIDIRTDRPTPARIYDYLLGGKDNFAVDREAAESMLAKIPEAAGACQANRRFIQRAVRFLTEEQGIDQFIDLGTGLPTQGNVHEIAHESIADAHVVYVDNDPIVLAHARALLARDSTTTVITADMRDPEGIIEHPEVKRLIDLSRPVAVLFAAVLHFLTDEENPAGVVQRFAQYMAPGSYVVISHDTRDGRSPAAVHIAETAYQHATSPLVFRDRDQVMALFEGFELVEPGLTTLSRWRPDMPIDRAIGGGEWMYAGVGRKISD